MNTGNTQYISGQSVLQSVESIGPEKATFLHLHMMAGENYFSYFFQLRSGSVLTMKCTECCLLCVVLCLFCLAALNMHTETNKQNPICLGKVKHCLKLM